MSDPREDVDVQRFTSLCKFEHKRFGGNVPAQLVAEAVYATLDADRYKSLTWGGFVNKVRAALAATDTSGLPHAAAMPDGNYKQRALWEVDDYRFVIVDHVKRSESERQRAYRFARECRSRYDVWIDPATVLDAGAA